jgi:tetratricopeptide (TPR) repeat protein
MAEIGSALAALEGLKTAVEAVGSAIRGTGVLRAERKAGQSPFSINKSALEASFDGTLSRLQAVDETWWRDLLAKLAHAYIAPDLFRIQSVQNWLALAQTQDDLKALARAKIAGVSEDDQARARLYASFMQATGDNEARARDAASVCVAILLAGAKERLSPELEVFSDIDATRHEETRKIVRDGIRARSGQTVVAKIAKDELAQILKRRSIPGVDALQELNRLLERLEGGDLKSALELVEPELRYWLARLNAGANPADAEKHLKRLRALDPSRDARIVEAWLIVSQDGFDAAIQHIRDVDDPDARSTLVVFLLRKNPEHALEWLKEHKSEGTNLLTGIGWRNAAVLLAEHGHWEEAAEVLSRLSAAHRVECPAIALLEGVIHAAMLLPLKWRAYALRANVFHPDMARHIREDEGAQRHRARGHVPGGGVGAVGRWPAGATARSLA